MIVLPKYKNLLMEDRGSKNLSQVRRYIQQRNQNVDPQQIIDTLRHDIPNIRLPHINNTDIYQFALGVARMYLDGEIKDGRTISQLNSTLKYVATDAHINEYDKNLNGLSCDELIKRFQTVVTSDIDNEKIELSKLSYVKSDYKIVPIDTPEQAAEYGDYTSWCVTHDEDAYNDYTCDGIGRFYFCLKPGFEQVEPVEGENCPLDEYGLSMIAVSVNMDGSPNTITCRWNHDNGGNDNVMTTKQLSLLIGANFYDVFKPYTRDELHAKGKILFDEVPELLAQGKKPKEIFEYIDHHFYNGYARIGLNGKYNFINENGGLLSPNQWFDWADDFSNGYAIIRKGSKSNFIKTNGELVSPNQWFDMVNYFKYGFAEVKLNNKYNWININGKYLYNQWLDAVGLFYNGYAEIALNGKYNFVNTNGELLWNKPVEQWFDDADRFSNGFASVCKTINGKYKWNFINTNGELISPNQWFDKSGPFEQCFNHLYNFSGCFANVQLNGEWYCLRKDGVLCDFNTRLPIEGINESKQKKSMFEKMMEPLKQKRIYLTENQIEDIKHFLNQARLDTNTHATEKQKKAGNYKHGRVRIHGFEIALENPKGSYRTGKDKNGREWKIKMQNDYGYFTRTLGKDGDAVDVFIGPNLTSETIYCVDQKLGGKFDETKVMMGFDSAEQAKSAYLANYEENWKGFWKITAVSLKDFKEWLYDGYRQRKPFFEYVDIKKKKLN